MNGVEIANILDIRNVLENGHLLADGFESVEFEEVPAKKRSDQEEIEEFKTNHLALHTNDFNGKIMAYASFEVINKKLKLYFHKSDFMTFLFDRNKRKSMMIPKSFDPKYCMALSMGAVTITSDGYLIFGWRKNTAIEKDKIMLVAGGYFNYEVDCFISDKGVVYSDIVCLLKEMWEEINIRTFKSIRYFGLIYGEESMQPMIGMEVHISYTSEEMKKIVADNDELKNICFVRDDIYEVAEFLKGKDIAVYDAWKLLLYYMDKHVAEIP